MQLAGYSLHLGLPRNGDGVAIWGDTPTADRGRAIATKRDVPLVHVEDAWIRSLYPGRRGEGPLGLVIDHSGPHFDPAQPSDLEKILANAPLDDTAVLNQARACIARLQEAHVTKYNAVTSSAPPPGYVLVIDQTFNDASVRASAADRSNFLEMLVFAQEEHPGLPVFIKTHPETAQGLRKGYFHANDLMNDRISFLTDPISPWALFEGAVGVYTVSSQLGFEAIFAGHKPRVFGKPFYAGWGLTDDEFPVQRRQRRLSKVQLFAAAMMLYPKWYDPFNDQLTSLPEVIETAATAGRAWREDHQGWAASGVRLWKRKQFQRFFGQHKPVVFTDSLENAPIGRRRMVWASTAKRHDETVMRVEDGFVRSRGLGAQLTPPLSLVCDDLGTYYDSSRPSRLEELIAKRATLRPDQQRRAANLRKRLTEEGLSKYNLRNNAPPPDARGILVVGQVQDDASVLTGAGDIATNAALLAAARAARPDAQLIYKPHPDVEAGLRDGGDDLAGQCDQLAQKTDPSTLLGQVDEVWTMTSLLGFEALLRGVPVVTTGVPFYAGWGLTDDRGNVPPRRRADVSLDGLVHAALIDYPRYFDPKTKLPCPVEVIVERLASGEIEPQGLRLGLLSKLQGLLASQSHLWRGR